MKRKSLSIHRFLLLIIIISIVIASQAVAQVTVVDMIPTAMSGETNRDSEPYLTVNPANPLIIAATAFLVTPNGSSNGPLLVSTDGGLNWVTRNIIPSMANGLNTFDVTIRFNSAGTVFYAALLRDNTVQLEIQRTTDMTLNTVLTATNTPRLTDQPYIYARTVTAAPDAGDDRVWVGNNDAAANPASATVDQSIDAAITTPVFTQIRIDAGSPAGRDNYQVRTVAHDDGHVYAAFYRRTGSVSGGYNADVVVVRDDDWGRSTPPFQNLVDSVTLVAGQNVVAGTTVSDTFGSSAALGNEWWGGDLYLTVDPNNSARVYISYSDSLTGAARTLHLRRSTDFGQTWSADLLTTPSAKNAAIAITSQGTIGYLYQRLAGTTPNLRWQTHLRRSADGNVWDDITLADFPAEGAGSPGGSRIIGDYLNMVAVGNNFYGVFSSYNDLVNANFPQGVTWLRNKTPDTDPSPRFLAVDGVTTVAPSIDPFFFSVIGPQPQIQVPGNISLGGICAGTTGSATLNVCNTGKADLIVSAINSSNATFSVTTPSSGYPVTISPDFCFPFQVLFNVASSGPQSGTLTVLSNDPNTPTTNITISGSGSEPDIRVTGSTDFGIHSAWTPAEKTISVCNTGACDLSVTSATVGCSDFTLINNPFPAKVSPDSCLNLVVRFTPVEPYSKSCPLSIASNDPDTPTVNLTLTGKTPPLFSVHGGVVIPHGSLNNIAKLGSTINVDFVYPFTDDWAWDLRLGFSHFDGEIGFPDIDLTTLLPNLKFMLNPSGTIRVFLNGGLGMYHFSPGDFEAGGNLGAGLNIPVGRRFQIEGTYNHHWAFTASPVLRFSQVQGGLLVSF